jgi:ABC-type Na+ efflux pump permease subunit
MNSWPILQRELQVSARDWRLSYGRSYAPAVMFLFLGWLLWMFRGVPALGMPGDFIFRFIAYIAFGVSVFGGAMRTSDTLSREKREETLGLLFLTDLSGLDIVLGKLFAAAIRTLYGVLATIPVLGVGMLFGGVTLSEVLRVGVSLLMALFFSLCAGLIVSSVVRPQRRAQSLSGFTILIFVVLLPIAAEGLRQNWYWPRAAHAIELLSPLYSQNMSFSSALGLSTNTFWTSIATQFIMAVTFLFLAAKLIERTWKLRPPDARTLTWKDRWIQWTAGDAPTRLAYRKRLLATNPFFWLSARDRLGPWWALLMMIVTISLGIICIWYYALKGMEQVAAMVTTFIVLDYYFKMRIAAVASQQLGQDRQSGSLELILSTPTSVKEIIRGQWLGLCRNFLGPILLLWTLEITVFSSFRNLGQNNFPVYILPTFLFVSAGDALCIAWIAMWKAMRLFNPMYAAGTALLRVAVLPWFVFGIALSALAQWRVTKSWWDHQPPSVGVAVGLAVWAVVVAGSAIKARHSLYKQFRAAATDRFQLKSRLAIVIAFWRQARARAKPSACIHAGAPSISSTQQ